MQYQQHCVSNLSIGILLSAGVGAMDLPLGVRLAFAGSFVVATFLLSPDLDLFHSSPSRNWGYLRAIWWPYTKLFKHRGLSHVPVIGTSTRFVYLAALIGITVVIFDMAVAFSSGHRFNMEMETSRSRDFIAYIMRNQDLGISVFAGATASDLAHLFVDGLGSFLKRL